MTQVADRPSQETLKHYLKENNQNIYPSMMMARYIKTRINHPYHIAIDIHEVDLLIDSYLNALKCEPNSVHYSDDTYLAGSAKDGEAFRTNLLSAQKINGYVKHTLIDICAQFHFTFTAHELVKRLSNGEAVRKLNGQANTISNAEFVRVAEMAEHMLHLMVHEQAVWDSVAEFQPHELMELASQLVIQFSETKHVAAMNKLFDYRGAQFNADYIKTIMGLYKRAVESFTHDHEEPLDLDEN